MNKKLLATVIVGIMTLAVVNAGVLAYFGQVNTDVDVTQPISFSIYDGSAWVEKTGLSVENTIECDAGETCLGDWIGIGNSGDSDRTVNIDFTTPNPAVMSYIGSPTLTIPAGGFEQFKPEYKVNPMAESDTYTVSITINPQ